MDNQRAIRAEQSLLGALLIDNAAWDRIADAVTEADFCRTDHRAIFAVIAELAAAGNAFDPVTIADRLPPREVDSALPYLRLLDAETPSAANAAHYARSVREQSILRQLIAVCAETIDQVTDAQDEPRAILEAAVTRVSGIAEQTLRGEGPRRVAAVIPEVVEKLEAMCQRKGSLVGTATGFADLDKMTSGLKPQELVILAARPSMGKTTLAMNIAANVAGKAAHPVLVFSLEMSAQALTYRLISSLGRIDHGHLQAADMDADEWQRVTSTTMRIKALNLQIDDSGGLTLTDLAARARRAHREAGGLALVVVDYLQLLSITGKIENRTIEVTKISQGLKALAKSLQCPVLALSQLNRGVEQRTNRRPMMADLRDSGSIEQDADLIVFLYREEVYNPETDQVGVAEAIIAKQRNGPTGTVRLAFDGKFSAFGNLAYDWQPPPRETPEPKPQASRKRYDY